ncbi:MAG: hypothetical protein ACO3CR_03605 [Solirubrobacterales bacterium]
MFNRGSRVALLAVLPLLVASPMVLAACSGDDEESDRQASGGRTLAWEGQTGNAYLKARGVEVKIVNTYRVKDRPMNVGISAKGVFCPDSLPRPDSCEEVFGGTSPRKVPANEFAKWKAYTGTIYNEARSRRSVIKWIRPDGKLGVTEFSIAYANWGAPEVRFEKGLGCRLQPSVVELKVAGQTTTAVDESSRCQIKLDVTRLDDSKEFWRFRITAR